MNVAAVVLLLSYLLGSLVAGILYSRFRGEDIRERDLPGGSGTYRQYGKGAALGVALADGARGALAVWLAHLYAPEWSWLAVAGVVAGQCFPVFFRFSGGGGIATLLGAMAIEAPITLLTMWGSAFIVMALYTPFKSRVGINAIPFSAFCAVPLGLYYATHWGGFKALLAAGAVMTVRALGMNWSKTTEAEA